MLLPCAASLVVIAPAEGMQGAQDNPGALQRTA